MASGRSATICISRWSTRTKVQRLPIERISQASADQRKGRCGRVAAGVCYRLYSEPDYQSRPRYTDPEILRASLGGVILRMLSLGLGKVEDFPFIDAPDPRAISEGWQQLGELARRQAALLAAHDRRVWPCAGRVPAGVRAGRDRPARR